MIKKKYFEKEESVYHPGKYIIRPKYDEFFLESTEGSFNIICARLFNLSYASYLKMCRDCFGAQIIGKGGRYPVAYFTRSKELDGLLENLNARANAVIWLRDHPDYEEHEAYVKEHCPVFYKEVMRDVSN